MTNIGQLRLLWGKQFEFAECWPFLLLSYNSFQRLVEPGALGSSFAPHACSELNKKANRYKKWRERRESSKKEEERET